MLGLTCMNDVTARDLQKKDGRYTRAKGFDTFAPLGPCIATGLSADDLEVTGLLNGEVRQQSSTRELIFPVATLIAYISRIMTLLPGDIVSTGTPAASVRCRPATSRRPRAGHRGPAQPVVGSRERW